MEQLKTETVQATTTTEPVKELPAQLPFFKLILQVWKNHYQTSTTYSTTTFTRGTATREHTNRSGFLGLNDSNSDDIDENQQNEVDEATDSREHSLKMYLKLTRTVMKNFQNGIIRVIIPLKMDEILRVRFHDVIIRPIFGSQLLISRRMIIVC
jgi:uncharacterized protein YqhQ